MLIEEIVEYERSLWTEGRGVTEIWKKPFLKNKKIKTI